MTIQLKVLGSDNGARYEFYLVEQDLNPLRSGWLVTPKTFIPLLYQWTYLIKPLISVAGRGFTAE